MIASGGKEINNKQHFLRLGGTRDRVSFRPVATWSKVVASQGGKSIDKHNMLLALDPPPCTKISFEIDEG